ncbi:MAG: hypothetical protein V4535_08015 [Bacteroidota bacterium]
MSEEIILYRGPLERARLKLLISAVISRKNSKVTFVWIFPKVLDADKKKHFDDFISQFALENVYIFRDKGLKALKVKKEINEFFSKTNFEIAHYIGFKSYFFAGSITAFKKVWYVNGIPEEMLLNADTITNRVKCSLNWFLVKIQKKPDLIVTVSQPMREHVRRKTFETEFFITPITVDNATFTNSNKPKKYLTYLGSGAPWQAIDLLEKLWYEISLVDEKALFRVISRDKRCDFLAKRIPKERIHFCSSSDFKEVAEFLSESKMGFLIRRNHIVNNVSFPTKYAEYVASGAFVALSAIEWDLNQYIRKFNTGILVDPNSPLNETAQKIVSFLAKNTNESHSSNFEASTTALSNKYWITQLNDRLNTLV